MRKKYLKNVEEFSAGRLPFHSKFINLSNPKKEIFHYKAYLIRYILKNYFKSKKNLTILDIGAGNGIILKNKFSAVKKRIAFDIDEFHKKDLNTNGIDFFKVNLEKDFFPLEDNSIDLILCSHVIEHLNNYDLLFNEAKRVLKKNGIFIIITPDILKNPNIRLTFWGNIPPTRYHFWDDPTHIKPYSMKGLTRLGRMYDFEILVRGHFPCLEYILLNIKSPDFIERFLNKFFHKFGRFNLMLIMKNE